ncbi:MAG: TauD/TfdA family dioxygenase, partial [Polyangiaceae bacterium]
MTPVIGAEVTGVDLREELDASTVLSLRKALLEHKVLFFRDQPINDEQQVRFTRYLGGVTPAHPITNGRR